MSNVPAVVETHLDALSYDSSGKIILGSSNLTGRYWNGSLWCFKDVSDAPEVEKCLAGTELSSGICDLVCLDKSRTAVALDSGSLEIYHLDAESSNFTNEFRACEHDDFVTSISVSSDKTRLVSSSADKCIKVWDLDTYSTTETYRPVHAGIIWQIACSTEDPHLFASCGQDGKILLLDRRLAKPAVVIDSSPLKSEITAISWNPHKSNQIAVGDESGHIAIKDIKKNVTLSSWDAHKRRVFRIKFSPRSPWLGSCSDDTDVCAMDLDKDIPTLMYKNNDHDDFVRDLAWSPENYLISCAWDKKVLKHVFTETDVTV
ncbi:methylosome protein 50-like [Uloborus diversus]|uniref:methylosome protein 50-like n=1 Tax=Uloborus diversus TaxID=327109 RepID=UPI002409BEC7|nr:methylosome protein 50-like [Uloborus diversus]XP_054723692.1 methylosome protein 50-like [Uloborus diversus]